jgi:hypothetical protein
MTQRIKKSTVHNPRELVRLLEALDTEIDALRAMVNEVRTDRATILTGTDTWDPGSIGDGNEAVKEVTVTGAALGDLAIASFSLDVSDLAIVAAVTAADTVTVQLGNWTGGGVDLAEGTVTAMVIPAAAFTNTAAAVTEQVESGN